MGRSPILFLAAISVLCVLASVRVLAAQAGPVGEILQGDWEGHGPPGKISLRFSNNSLHFFVRADFWYEATFTLPTGEGPQQMRATITDSSPPRQDIGEIVFAIVKFEDGMLSLAVDDGSDEAPMSFSSAMSRYDLRRAPPPERKE